MRLRSLSNWCLSRRRASMDNAFLYGVLGVFLLFFLFLYM